MLRLGGARLLDDRDQTAVQSLLATDPIGTCAIAARVENTGLQPDRLGAQMWGYAAGDGLDAACYAGANLVPIGTDPEALSSFAERARRQGRRCSSIVGRLEAVAPLWQQLEPYWGPPRAVRARQPLLAIDALPAVAPDPLVRQVRPEEFDILLPACVAMFTEEVGVSPLGADGGALYRARVRELIARGRAFARIEGGRVLFKAELGAVSSAACQVQGVWVDPTHRGAKLSVGGMAAVASLALQDFSPLVSLYVNDFNTAARAAYQRVGFREVGTFSSVMF